jgi:uracil-DNA glycosylase
MNSLASLRKDAAECRACPLWKNATQTIFGEGPADADVMLVGEQPGDQEDRRGHPFVGPAGRMLDDALAAAGITRERGQPLESDLAPLVVATFHPSAVLRAQDRRGEMEAQLTEDLRAVAAHLD